MITLRRRVGLTFQEGDQVEFVMSGTIEAARRSPSGPRKGRVVRVISEGVMVYEKATGMTFMMDEAQRFDKASTSP